MKPNTTQLKEAIEAVESGTATDEQQAIVDEVTEAPVETDGPDEETSGEEPETDEALEAARKIVAEAERIVAEDGKGARGGIRRKQAQFDIKAAGTVDFVERTFTGYAAVFNNRDDGGDVIMPGAFTNTLPRVNAGKVKLMDAHDHWGGTRAVLGKVLSAVEDDHGLLCTFYVSVGMAGDDLLHKISDGSLDALSIGYETIVEEEVTSADAAGNSVRTSYLKELKLYEVSVVVWGMNPLALIDPASVKALPPAIQNVIVELVKEGRRNSSSDAEVIQGCIDMLSMAQKDLRGLIASDTSAPAEGAGGKDSDAELSTEDASDNEGEDKEAAKEAEIDDMIADLRVGLITHV